MNRTHYNGQLRIENVGQTVELKGWVAKKRDLGGLVFIDLRDKTGITQIIVNPNNPNYDTAVSLKNEYVVYVKGIVEERSSKNPNLSTGDIEVVASDLEILNTANQPPIIIADKTDALEDTRLKYRYLDLRRPVMQNYMIMKSKITNAIREFLVSKEFLELETPILAKSTPEGARDFLVPSRLHEGEFYALPQSPQIFKQLYMVAGFERYFQIAKCFRDEDLRADRQLEFNQIDIETSFLNDREIQEIIEGLFKHLFKKVLNKDIPTPFPRMTYNEAMNTYGSDKPDIRFDMKLIDVAQLFKNVPFMADKEAVKCIKANATYTRKQIDEFTRIMKVNHANGLAYLKYENDALTGSFVKFLTDEDKENTIKTLNLVNGDIVFVIADKLNVCNQALGALRKLIAKDLNLCDPDDFKFLWVTDFPIFEYNEDLGKYEVSTNPFSSPKKECIPLLETDPKNCYADAYDIVLNGYELGSGSLRIYNQDLQSRMFDVIGISEEEAKYRFGFFLEALKYGTPPMGGIGLGLERIVMCMTKTDNIRDVIAFPKTLNGVDLMMEAPSRVEDIQLDDVHISLKK
ncbi:MAG: aspartate--tRNA ligase [Anaeroplasmataceae bacterium]